MAPKNADEQDVYPKRKAHFVVTFIHWVNTLV